MAIKLKRKSICRRRFKYSAHILAENAVFKVRIYTEYLELLRATSSASVLSLSFTVIAIQVNYCILLFPISVTI